jgi:hypothetical protein
VVAVIDWYFAGMFYERFWAVVGKQKLKGRTAADVLRPLAKAGEPDLSWMSKVQLLDALCRLGLSFAMKRRGMRVQWALTPFRDPPGPSGDAETIGEAIDALIGATGMR